MYGKAIRNSLGGPDNWVGWGGASEIHYSGANSVSQVDGDSDMAPTWALSGGRVRKGTMVSASTSVPPSSRPNARHFGSSPYATGAFRSAAHNLELRGSKSVCGPLRGTARESSGFCLSQPHPLLVFIVRSYGELSSWQWNPGLGILMWGWDPSLLRYPSLTQISSRKICC